MKTIKVNLWREIPDNFTGIAKFKDGTKRWFQDGDFHRLDGPAIECRWGTKEYWILGTELTKEEFDIFRYLWNNTNYERTNNLIEIFIKLAKIK